MQTDIFELTKDIFWVGVNDYELRNFDIIMTTEFGSSYNAYLIRGGEKTALVDTVKAEFCSDYLAKLAKIADIPTIDYLIVNHTEPDHSGSIINILEANPDITIVASAPALSNLREILNRPFKSLRATSDLKIDLGGRSVTFIMAPNLHWPDTMFSYVPEEEILFTCDFFGAHYAFEGVLAKNVPDADDYHRAFREYYDAIMSPFKPFVLKGLDKIKDLPIRYVATSHGPVVDETYQNEAVHHYRKWSEPKKPGKPLVIIPVASAYGYTKAMAAEIIRAIRDEFIGDIDIEEYDVVTSKVEKIVERIVQCDGFLIGSTTILRDSVRPIWEILASLNPEIDGHKVAGAFGSYGWSGEAVPLVTERLRQLKMKTVEGLKVRFKPSEEQLKDTYDFGKMFAKTLKENLGRRD